MALHINTVLFQKYFRSVFFVEWNKNPFHCDQPLHFTMNLTDLQIHFSKQGNILSIYRKAKL